MFSWLLSSWRNIISLNVLCAEREREKRQGGVCEREKFAGVADWSEQKSFFFPISSPVRPWRSGKHQRSFSKLQFPLFSCQLPSTRYRMPAVLKSNVSAWWGFLCCTADQCTVYLPPCLVSAEFHTFSARACLFPLSFCTWWLVANDHTARANDSPTALTVNVGPRKKYTFKLKLICARRLHSSKFKPEKIRFGIKTISLFKI